MLSRGTPSDTAVPSTHNLSDVPIGVVVPPIWETNVMGINRFEGAEPERVATADSSEVMSTTCDVLFMNALITAVHSRTHNQAPTGE